MSESPERSKVFSALGVMSLFVLGLVLGVGGSVLVDAASQEEGGRSPDLNRERGQSGVSVTSVPWGTAPPSDRTTPSGTMPLSGEQDQSGSSSDERRVDADDRDLLWEIIEVDQPLVDDLMGYWVPQLSSTPMSTIDTSVDDHDDPHSELLDRLLSQRARYGEVLLVDSSALATFDSPDYWVTLVAEPYLSPEDANDWCEDAGRSPDDCFARLITDDPGIDPSSSPRS